MNWKFNPYHEWLGLPPDVVHPHYYQLLGIAPGMRDERVITQAAERAVTRLYAQAPGEHASRWGELLDELAEARAVLLDPVRRAQYDRELGFRQKAAARGTEPPLPPVAHDVETPGAAGPLDPMAPLPPLPPPAADPMSPLAATGVAPGWEPATVTARGPAASRRRKRRSSWMPFVLSIASVALLVVLGYIGWQWREQRGEPPQPEIAAVESPEAIAGLPTTTSSTSMAEPSRTPQRTTGGREAPGPAASDWPQSGQLSSTETPAENSTDERPAAEMPDGAVAVTDEGIDEKEEPPMAVASEAEPAPVTPPTPEELVQLKQLLTQARAALGEEQFERAAEQLKRAEQLARLPEHQAMVARLQQLADYVEQFHKALAKAAQEFPAGEPLTVGSSTVVAVVEATAERLVVRVNGMNRRYLLKDMPTGLAVALVDRGVDASNPLTPVLKGAYVAVQKNTGPAELQKARAWWEEAIQAEVIPAELLPALDESYEQLAP